MSRQGYCEWAIGLTTHIEPCPFCGNKEGNKFALHADPTCGDDSQIWQLRVMCDVCAALGPYYNGNKSVEGHYPKIREAVIKAWNTRKLPPLAKSDLQRAMDEIKERFGLE